MRAGNAGGEHGGGCGFNRNDLDGGVLGLQILTDAGDRAACADARDKDVHLAVGVVPDLGTRGCKVRGGVRRVDKLPGDKAVRDLLRKFVCLGDRALHALRAFGQHQLRAVCLHQLAALHRHGLGHHNDDAVTARCRHRGKPDAGVAAGRLDDDRVGLQQSLCLGVVDHRLGNAVLDRSGGVEVFQLCQYLRAERVFFFNVGQLQERRLADQLIGGCIDVCRHGRFLRYVQKLKCQIKILCTRLRQHRKPWARFICQNPPF